MPYMLSFTDAAKSYLFDIAAYIAADNVDAADRFINRLRDTCNLLADNPMLGRSRPELSSGLRSFPVGQYVVYYSAQEAGTEIIRVLRGSRDLQMIFGEK